MGAIDSCLEPNAVYDFYDGLAALLRIYDNLRHEPCAPLATWLPRAQGYLQVALKHLPEIGGVDYAQRGLAQQWRTANLLACAAPISARWLQQQLNEECAMLVTHAGFYWLCADLPEDAAVVSDLARRRAVRLGLFWD